MEEKLNEILDKLKYLEDKIDKLSILVDDDYQKCNFCDKYHDRNTFIKCYECSSNCCDYCKIEREYYYYHKFYKNNYCPKC
jgi:hypothetical protein